MVHIIYVSVIILVVILCHVFYKHAGNLLIEKLGEEFNKLKLENMKLQNKIILLDKTVEEGNFYLNEILKDVQKSEIKEKSNKLSDTDLTTLGLIAVGGIVLVDIFESMFPGKAKKQVSDEYKKNNPVTSHPSYVKTIIIVDKYGNQEKYANKSQLFNYVTNKIVNTDSVERKFAFYEIAEFLNKLK